MKHLVRIGIAVLMVFGLTGCLTHWVVDTSTRLQVQNKTDRTFAQIQVVADSDSSQNLVWIPDTLAPGNSSRVYEMDMVGTFHFRVLELKKDCLEENCWEWLDLGLQEILGGSVVWQLQIEKDQVILRMK